MSDAKSHLENYSYKEIKEVLANLKKTSPAVYRWFIIWELEKLHGTRESDPGLDQEQETYQG
jgi:hypothetical protein